MFWIAVILILLAITVFALSAWKKNQSENSHPPVGEFLSVDGKQIHYLKRGSGPILIMLHGAGGNLRDFTHSLIPKLEENYTIIAIDRPAHGYTEVFDSNGETLELQAEIIVKAAEKLGVTSAQILGYSFGGTVATRIALDYPNFVESLVLVSAPLHTWPDDWVSSTYKLAALPYIGPALMHVVHAFFPSSYFENGYSAVFTPQSPPKGYLDHVGVGLTVRPTSFVANSRQILPLAPQIKEMIPRYKNLSLPIEILHGTADKSVSSKYHAEDFLTEAVKAETNAVFLENMGHGTHQLAQDEILQALKRLSN